MAGDFIDARTIRYSKEAENLRVSLCVRAIARQSGGISLTEAPPSITYESEKYAEFVIPI